MKVGDYVRTKHGIAKVEYIDDETGGIDCDSTINIKFGERYTAIFEGELEKIIKTSPNIIDLIEEGDYVNGFIVYEIKNGQLKTISYYDDYVCHLCNDYEIKSIVTKEQFESMKYKIGE